MNNRMERTRTTVASAFAVHDAHPPTEVAVQSKGQWAALLCLGLLGFASIGDAAGPQLPFEDHGACPFECCTYRDWVVNEETTFRATPDADSSPLFTAAAGEAVLGLTGVVVTTKPGRITTKLPILVGLDEPRLAVEAGAVLYVLHYEGEGCFKVWYQGSVFVDEFPFPPEWSRPEAPHESESAELVVESAPVTVWWVKVRNAQGLEGWSRDVEHFDHMDACG